MEEVETKPEEIVEEQPKAGFLKKLRTHNFKILGGVLGILVFAGAVFGAYKLGQKQVKPDSGLTPTPEAVATPTPDPTVNWKTYTNTKLGFSVKYPEDWPEPEERLLATRTEVEFGSDASIGVGVIYNQEKQRELTYLEIARQYSNGKKEPQLITVDDQPAAYLKMREEDLVAPKPNPFILVTIQKGKTVYMFYYSFSTVLSDQENEQIFNLMLSTFRFLPSTSSGQGE